MNEVRVQRLIQRYKDNGKLDSEDPALVMIKTWPTSRKYKDNPDKLPGLEQLVCRLKRDLIHVYINSNSQISDIIMQNWCYKFAKNRTHSECSLGNVL